MEATELLLHNYTRGNKTNMSLAGLISNATALFDMDAMRDEILEKEKEIENKETKESIVHRSDTIIAKKRRELNGIPVVSASSLLSPDEARKLSSFSRKTSNNNSKSIAQKNKKLVHNNNNESINSKNGDDVDDDRDIGNINNKNNNNSVEIDIDGDLSDDEIEYMKKKKRMENEKAYEPGKAFGRYTGMFSRDENCSEDDEGGVNNDNSSTIGFKSIKTFLQKHVNFQMLYFSLIGLGRQIKNALDEYKVVVWLFLSFLLIYKFLF
jgi:hypothetical protein